jgi:tetratricopeptide (TPR) repeat protein
MSKNFIPVLILIGLATFLVVAYIASPRIMGLYYQLKGGQQLEKILRKSMDQSGLGLTCDPLSQDEMGKDKVEIAIQNLDKAVSLNPSNSQAYLQLGRAHCLMGDPEKAKVNYRKYSELRPKNPLGYLGLGFANELLGDSSAAKLAWEKAGLTANDFRSRGDEVFETGNYENASDWYTRSILMDPSQVRSWINLGKAHTSLNAMDTALQAFQEAWHINPEVGAAEYANILAKKHYFQTSEEILIGALEEFPDSLERITWWKALGEITQTQKKYGDAVEIYQTAIEEYPEDIDLHIALGWVYFVSRSDGQLAELEFLEAIEINPKSGKGYFALAQLHNREGHYTDAEPYYQKALEFSPGNRWYSLDRANNARQAGDYQSSIKYYQETIARFPDFVQAYYHASLAYQLAGQESEAIKMIRKALKLMNPPDEDVYVRAGEIYRQAGFKEKAVAAYQDALTLNPSNEVAKKGLELLDK